jgi:cytochrome c oxidase subunit 2
MLTRRHLLLGLLGAAAGALAQGEERVIRVTARKFSFSPEVIELKKDAPVTLEFETADVAMGFNAPDFKLRTDIAPGKVSRLRLVPEKAGEFEFHCDVFCGDDHENMSGTIRVVS